MGIRMRMGPSIPPHGHGGEARWRWDGWRRHHDSRASQRLWGQDPCALPRKAPQPVLCSGLEPCKLLPLPFCAGSSVRLDLRLIG